VNRIEERRAALERGHPSISIRRQCELLGLNRATAYYRKRPEDPTNVALREAIREQYEKTPFYGVPRMTESLRQVGRPVGPKRVRRLTRSMGLMAIYPKRRLSLPNKAHKVYPYLLRDVKIERPDQVWATDITYIHLKEGCAYLTAVLDWASRYVLSWELSNTLDAAFCVDALEEALAISKPEIFNSDQGSQYTGERFTGRLKEAEIQISMDGKGRALDNVIVERFWRSVKYEEVYLHDYASMSEARKGVERYMRFYNHERPHSSLGWRTPAEKYFDNREAEGESRFAPVAATPVALRAPSVAATVPSTIHLKSEQNWS